MLDVRNMRKKEVMIAVPPFYQRGTTPYVPGFCVTWYLVVEGLRFSAAVFAGWWYCALLARSRGNVSAKKAATGSGFVAARVSSPLSFLACGLADYYGGPK